MPHPRSTLKVNCALFLVLSDLQADSSILHSVLRIHCRLCLFSYTDLLNPVITPLLRTWKEGIIRQPDLPSFLPLHLLYFFLPASLPLCLLVCFHACLPVCLHAYLPTCLPTFMFVRLHVCLSACLNACPSFSSAAVKVSLATPNRPHTYYRPTSLSSGKAFQCSTHLFS